MGTPTAGQRADGGLRRELNALQEHVRQLRERAARPQKIPTASGGVEGIARVWAWNLTQAVTSPSTQVTPADLELTADLSGTGPSVTLGTTDFTVTDAGFYLLKVDAWLGFLPGDAATIVQFQLDYTGSNYHFPRQTVPVHPDITTPGSSGPDAITSWSVGPVAIDAGGTVTFTAQYNDDASTASVNYWSVDVCKLG